MTDDFHVRMAESPWDTMRRLEEWVNTMMAEKFQARFDAVEARLAEIERRLGLNGDV